MTVSVNATWKEEATIELRKLAASGVPFSSDDLTAKVGVPDGTHSPNGVNSGVGGIFGGAARAGLIEMVGVMKSSSSHRKGGMIRVWRGR